MVAETVGLTILFLSLPLLCLFTIASAINYICPVNIWRLANTRQLKVYS